MPKRNAPKPTATTASEPTYTKYQEWVDAGRPYWVGVSLFNQLNVLPQLRMLLNKRENPFNVAKLDSELKARLSAMPGTPAQRRRKGATPATPPPPPEQVAKDLGRLGPDMPKAYTDPKVKAPPYAALPAILQQGRIKAVETMRKRSALHDMLAGEYELITDMHGEVVGRRWLREPLSGELAEQTCRQIVELSDAIAAHFDAELNWVQTGALPITPASLQEELGALTDAQLERRLTNQVRPRISRWKRAMATREGEELVEAQMQLTLAEQEANAIKALQSERGAKLAQEVEQRRKEVKNLGDARRARDREAKRVRDAKKKAARAR